jgi:N-acetylmuramoyl-L-alanine amidase
MLKQGSVPVEAVFIHCSATRPDWMETYPLSAKVSEIARWHKQRGWGSIGYHYVIDRNGEVAIGRPETTEGAHVRGHNKGSIGICLIGGHGSSENDAFEKNFTSKQAKALRELISDIGHRAEGVSVRGHNEVAAKACPGFNVKRWMDAKPPKKKLTESTTMQASAAQVAAGAGAGITAVSALEGHAQLIVIAFAVVAICAAAWVMRERIKKWAKEQAE